MKNRKQSNNNTSHFENDFGAYLPLNKAIANCFISELIFLYL